MKKLILIAALIALMGCASEPKEPMPFGDEVAPPAGCIDARKRGHDC